MDPALAHQCNMLNLKATAVYLGCEPRRLWDFYEELRSDHEFLQSLNDQIVWARDEMGFQKALFAKGPVDDIDWFAFERILIYVTIRYLQPEKVLETGVFYGGNTAFALRAIQRNGIGQLISIDYPAAEIDPSEFRHSLVGDKEHMPSALRPGFLVPEPLKTDWDLKIGDSLKVIPTLPGSFDYYIHDSEHSMDFLIKEMEAVWLKRTEDLFCIVDDIDWSNGFFAFCVNKRLHPLLFTDNGKDDLRVRGGAIWVEHPNNRQPSFVGRA